MNKLKKLLDAHLQELSDREPYFAPTYLAARVLLDGAVLGNRGLIWASGAVCGPEGCSCGNPACLHRPAWRIFRGE